MKITQDVREYAQDAAARGRAALKHGLREKRGEFVDAAARSTASAPRKSVGRASARVTCSRRTL